MKDPKSIFTSNLNRCLITGMTTEIELHHVFEGRQGFKKTSEEFGFLVPLHRSIHGHGAFADSGCNWKDLDHWLKRMCQEYFLEVVHMGSREDWYSIFGKFYDDRFDEKVWLNGKWEWKL